ncbi:MAG: ArsC/Spx/MgsR family protein [Pseudomonadota bacterium]
MPVIIEYLKTPPTVSELHDIFKRLGLSSAIEMVRQKEDAFETSALSENSTNDEIFQAITEHPKLLERPIVITPQGAHICRPPEKVIEIL